MPTIAESHEQSQRLLRAGDLRGAAAILQDVLKQAPQDVNTLMMLSSIAQRGGEFRAASVFLQRAIAVAPQQASLYDSLGAALLADGQLSAAVQAGRQAVTLAPNIPQYFHHLGATLEQAGQLEEAALVFRKSLDVEDTFLAHYNLGTVLARLHRWDAAATEFQRAVKLHPHSGEAFNNLGVAYDNLGRLEDALEAFRRAVETHRSYEATCNVGKTLVKLGDFSGAEKVLMKAVSLEPKRHLAYNSLGNMFALMGKHHAAEDQFSRSIELRPDGARAHYNRSMLRLLRGNFDDGWPEYEWRWRMPGATQPVRSAMPWEGQHLDGRSLALYCEQGLGDTIQTVRFAAEIKRRWPQSKVTLICPTPWHALLRTATDLDQVLAAGDEQRIDYQINLFSIPRILGIKIDTIPAPRAYLSADLERIARLRSSVTAIEGFKVGIAWQGNPDYPNDKYRSIALEQFRPLSQCPGARLISLQKNQGSEQLAAFQTEPPLINLAEQLDTGPETMLDTAAAMMHLDLVITSDNATAHLAGALGVPVWVALPLSPNWRWLLEREDSPWYPTMRLFRQTKFNAWREVFARMASELTNLAAESR